MTTLPLGQLFIFGFEGPTLSKQEQHFFTSSNAAGFILFARNIESFEQLLSLNQSIFSLKNDYSAPLVTVDQEGGRVQRLKQICTPIPPMRTIGNLAKSNPKIAYQTGAMMAREMIALGFHLDFAPVLDVDSNPKNPIIGDRSFSDSAKTVSKLGVEFLQGMQQSGLGACAKHFPGHGDTDVDSHLNLPVLKEHDLIRLDTLELLPFEKAVSAGVASIMTAHILLPQIDPEFPATLSPLILQDLLRKKMNFEGVIFSDDIEMKALADRYEVKEIIKQGLNAGVDIFLICSDQEKMQLGVEALHQLLENNEVNKETVLKALIRVEKLKKTYMGTPAAPTLEEAKNIVRSKPHLNFAKIWANEA